MNELCFTVVVLNLNKFLTIDYNTQTLHKKKKFFIEDFFSKCDAMWPYLLKKSSVENLIFCAVKK